MIDVYLYVVLLVAAAAWRPWALAQGYRPRLDPNPVQTQRAYEEGYRRRLAARVVLPVTLVYFMARALTVPESLRTPTRFYPVVIGAVCAAFLVSSVGAALWRYRWDRAFVAQNPRFSNTVQPLALRLMGPATILVALSLFAGSAMLPEGLVVYGLIVAALVVLLGGQRLILKALIRSRIEVPPDSPLAQAAAETVARFGFVPKRTILVPSTVANAYALPDGTVMVTTALQAIATDREIGAILAHELAHVRDGDVPKIRRWGLLTVLLAMLFAAGLSSGLMALRTSDAFLIPVIVSAEAVFLTGIGLLRARMLHRMEFKCDRAAAEIGLGPALAQGLVKIHDYMGLPHHWVGIERRTMTHPSLDDRLAALGAR